MLSPKEISELATLSEDLMNEVTDYLLQDIIKKVKEAGNITGTAEYRYWLLKTYGIKDAKIKKELITRLKLTEAQAEELIDRFSETAYLNDYKKMGIDAPVFKENAALQQLVNGIKSIVDEDFSNITGTIGFVGPDGKFSELTKAYHKASDYAFKMTSSGAMSYDEAVYGATQNLINKGINVISYESGRITEVGAAVRRNVMSSVGNLTNAISEHNMEELGAEYIEVSAHAACAADHEHIQGRRYKYKDFQKINEGLKRHIGTLNCGHVWYPVKEDSKPLYTEQELKQMEAENNKGVNYEGKHYTTYEATQKQRQIERTIRKQKRKVEGYKLTGNKDEETKSKAKLQQLYSLYNKFSKTCNLPAQYARFR